MNADEVLALVNRDLLWVNKGRATSDAFRPWMFCSLELGHDGDCNGLLYRHPSTTSLIIGPRWASIGPHE